MTNFSDGGRGGGGRGGNAPQGTVSEKIDSCKRTKKIKKKTIIALPNFEKFFLA